MAYFLDATAAAAISAKAISFYVNNQKISGKLNIAVGYNIEFRIGNSNKFIAGDPNYNPKFINSDGSDKLLLNISADGKTASGVYRDSTSGAWTNLIVDSTSGAGTATPPDNQPSTGYVLTVSEIQRLNAAQITVLINNTVTTTQKTIVAGNVVTLRAAVDTQFISGDPANDGKNTNPYFYGSDEYGDVKYLPFVVRSDSPRFADVTYSGMSGGKWSKIEASVAVAPLYTFTQSDIDQLTNSGVTLTINGVAVAVGATVKAGDVFHAVAEKGRYFYLQTDESGDKHPSIYFADKNESGDKYYQYFTLSTDLTTADYTRVYLGSGINYGGLICLTEQKTNVVGTNNVYLINEDILSQVNKKRFKTVSGGGSDVSDVTYDYGQFILSLLNIPFTVPPENIIAPESIILANFDTTVLSPKINTDILEINLGEISVNGASNNLLDYANTVALLHLPRMDTIAIDLEYVINQTIKIVYLLDCYTGKATVNIYSDKINSPIVTKTVDIGVNIPYANTHNNAALDGGNIEIGGDNGVKTPFIELVKSDTLLSDGLFTIPVVDEAILNTATGFIQVENVELKTGALRNEKEMLLNILNNGVIIK